MLRSRMPSVSAGGDYGKGLFGREMGPLQDQLRHGEYDLLKCAPMLESDFVQVCLEMIFDCQRFVSFITCLQHCYIQRVFKN